MHTINNNQILSDEHLKILGMRVKMLPSNKLVYFKPLQQIPSFHTYHWFCFTIIMKAPAISCILSSSSTHPIRSYPNTESVYTWLITKLLPTISVSSSSKASAFSCNSSTSSSSSSSSSPSSSSSNSGLSSGCYTNAWNHRLKKVSMLVFSG